MEKTTRPSVIDDLHKYDYLKNKEDIAIIEVTEWGNKEGIDINIESKSGSNIFSLTYGELEAINYLSKVIEFGE